MLFLAVITCALLTVADPIRPYPLPDSYLQTTSILNHSSYVSGLDDPQWYLDNIPFVDFPDKSIQDVYYYRASVIKRHLKFGREGYGWLFTEFIHPVYWASKLQTIPDSAPHHVVEGRWLRNTRYVKDLISLYTRGGVEALSGLTYTHYMHRAIFEHAQATGDINFLTSQLQGMIASYDLWNVTVDGTTGLYHREPLSDAQEYSLPGYLTGGPNGGPVEQWNSFANNYSLIWLGPETYRPNFNAYMVAGARAIAQVADLANQSSLAAQWTARAEGLYSKMEDMLWSTDLNFWIDVVQGTNLKCLGRELIGLFPYRFDVGTSENMVKGLEASLNSHSFLAEFGPTTLEQSNPYFTALKNSTYCCIWQGQSWPFSTSVYLRTLAQMARRNVSTVATPEFFQSQFTTYVRTNYKDGSPYTAESHYPELDMWSGDSTNHSEHYLHSTFLDNVFVDLIGIQPTLDDRLELSPLVPENWTYFAVENLPYHGSLFSVIWDKDGNHYAKPASSTAGRSSNATSGPGLSVYRNGALIFHQASLSPVNVTLPSATADVAKLASQPRYDNIAVNPDAPWGYPSIHADYNFSLQGDYSSFEAWKLIDGLLWYDTTPDNRWTNNQSTTPFNTLSLTFPRPRTISSISLGIYADDTRGGVIACPDAIEISTNTTGSSTNSTSASNSTSDGTTNSTTLILATRSPWASCQPNALNTVSFDGGPVTTASLQIRLSNRRLRAVAVSEVQAWAPANAGPRHPLVDGLLGTFIGSFEGKARGMNVSVEDGGVRFGEGGWAEVAGVVLPAAGGYGHRNGTTTAAAAEDVMGKLTLVGKGEGTVRVQMNFLSSVEVTMSGSEEVNRTVEVPFLYGGNVVTVYQVSGTPWVEAIVVG